MSDVPLSVLGSLCFAWIVLTCGVAPVPNIEAWARAARTFPEPSVQGSAGFIHSSPVGIGIAHVLGVRDAQAYAAVHLVLLVVATVVAVAVVVHRFGRPAGRLVIAAVFASPVANILLNWLGQPDPLTLLFGVIVAVASRPLILTGVAAAATVTHQEQALVMLAGVLVARRAADDLRRHQAAGVVVGVAVALVGLALFKARYGMGVSRLAFAEAVGAGSFLRNLVRTWHVMLVVCFGATWVAVIGLGCHLGKRRQAMVAGALAALFAVSVFTLDATRVFALTSMPVVVVLIGHGARRLPRSVLTRVLAVTVAAGIAYPHIYVWEGSVFATSVVRTTSSLVS